MSRLSRYLLVCALIVFMLACNAITRPFNDAQNVVETAQSFATSMPIGTIQAVVTNMPVQTLESVASQIPDFGNMFDPKGEPVAEWSGIPIMPQATAGQEHDANNYSFKFSGTAKEAQDFYTDALAKLNWSTMITMPGDENGALMVFQKDSSILTITITASDGSVVVLLTKT